MKLQTSELLVFDQDAQHAVRGSRARGEHWARRPPRSVPVIRSDREREDPLQPPGTTSRPERTASTGVNVVRFVVALLSMSWVLHEVDVGADFELVPGRVVDSESR